MKHLKGEEHFNEEEVHELLGVNISELRTSVYTKRDGLEMKHTCGIISIALKDKLVHKC